MHYLCKRYSNIDDTTGIRTTESVCSPRWRIAFARYDWGVRLLYIRYVATAPHICRFDDHCGYTFFRGQPSAYSILTFFYGGLLLTVATFIYFAYLDNGYLISQFTDILQSPESQQAMKLYGVDKEMNDSLRVLSELRPIDYALNVLSSVILSGFFWGLPIALFMRKKQ